MEKIILVFYVYVGGMDYHQVSEYIDGIKKSLTVDDEIINYIVPIKTGETRIECLTPKLISENDFEDVKTILDRNQQLIDEFLKNKLKMVAK